MVGGQRGLGGRDTAGDGHVVEEAAGVRRHRYARKLKAVWRTHDVATAGSCCWFFS